MRLSRTATAFLKTVEWSGQEVAAQAILSLCRTWPTIAESAARVRFYPAIQAPSQAHS